MRDALLTTAHHPSRRGMKTDGSQETALALLSFLIWLQMMKPNRRQNLFPVSAWYCFI